MICTNCGASNPEDARFCVNCGAEVTLPAGTCPHCGAQVAPDDNFCLSCGQSLRDVADLSTPGAPPTYLETATPSASLPTRGLGDLLSETLRLFRENPRLFLGIGVLSQIPTLLAAVVSQVSQDDGGLFLDIFLVLVTLVWLFLSPFFQSAIVYAVAGKHLGVPVYLGACFDRAIPRARSLIIAWLVLVAIIVIFGLLSIILIGIPLLFYFMVIFWFYVEVITVESRGPLAALRRSRELVRGAWWRVFGIGVVYTLIVGAIVIIPISQASLAGGVAEGIVSALVGGAALAFTMIGSTLLYFDLRVRKEGFTLETLKAELSTPPQNYTPPQY